MRAALAVQLLPFQDLVPAPAAGFVGSSMDSFIHSFIHREEKRSDEIVFSTPAWARPFVDSIVNSNDCGHVHFLRLPALSLHCVEEHLLRGILPVLSLCTVRISLKERGKKRRVCIGNGIIHSYIKRLQCIALFCCRSNELNDGSIERYF